MRHWIISGLAIVGLVAAGCKDMISPHVPPEANTEAMVAGMVAATNDALKARSDAQRRITLTLNNAPEANEPLEQDFITEMVELFEKRNPDIQIQYSPWQYTPESFFERVKNRTLTDVVEVDAEQMTPIILQNCAADLTENVKLSPEIHMMNPEVFKTTSKDNRTYGVPLELHTMALFYNRRLLAQADDTTRTTKPSDSETTTSAKKAKGADDGSRDFLKEEPILLAQYAPPPQQYYYPPQQNTRQQQRTSRRGEQEVENYYGQQPRQRGRFRQQQPQQQQQQQQQQYPQQFQYPPGYYQQQYQAPPQQPGQSQGPRLYAPPDEDARARRVRSRRQSNESTSSQSSKTSKKTKETTTSETSDSGTTPEDTLTSEAELALLDQETSKSDSVTSIIETRNLPADWDQFIRLAVRLTDHSKGIYGYGPVLYASEGGREFSQWAILGGLEVQQFDGDRVKLDIHSRAAGEVAQFIKDLHWRFDVTPPPNKCYFKNLLDMYAAGKLAMMMLPAEASTIMELQRLGMPLDDIGISALPSGPSNRNHLTYGKCLIVNSQLDREKREAAFKWIMFMASPEVKRLRAQFFFREKEPTGAPEVPLYTHEMQQQYWQSIANFRTLPRYADYETRIARNLSLSPPYYTDRLYEAIAEGVRPIIELKDSDPYQAMTQVAVDFEQKYLLSEKPSNWFEFYYKVVTEGE